MSQQPTVNVSRMSPKLVRNLTTYSRKPKNYNGTINFEIDIMKKSYPINNLCQNLTLSLMFWFSDLFLSTLKHYLEHQLTAPENFGLACGKNVNYELIGKDFFMISISKLMVPL